MIENHHEAALEAALAQSLSVALGERDAYLRGHGERVAALAGELGQDCGLNTRELRLLELAAQLHDVGKIGIPDAILHKPSRLEPQEWSLMQSHPCRSERILAAVSCDGMHEVARVARQHHEAFDGTGYPDGLAGEAITPMARMIALADSYDAMATTRVYQRSRSHAQIVRELSDLGGSRYDPWLLTRFVAVVERSPQRVA